MGLQTTFTKKKDTINLNLLLKARSRYKLVLERNYFNSNKIVLSISCFI